MTTTAHKYMDHAWLRGLSGAELLLLRLRYGKSVATVVEGELNRRAHVAYADLEIVPALEPVVQAKASRRRSRGVRAA